MDRRFTLRCSTEPRIRFAVGESVATLGRAPDCTLVLDDRSVSRHHARLRVDGARLHVLDLGSRNGTFVDGRQVDSAWAQPGQTVQFGVIAFTTCDGTILVDEETADPPPAAQAARAGGLVDDLSRAQRRVFDLLRGGLSEKAIARRLHLSPHTVHNHTREIFRRCRVHSRSELLAMLLPPSPRE